MGSYNEGIKQVFKETRDLVKDNVNNPVHYNQAGIECIEAIKAMTSTMKGPGAYMAGNILKYLWRHEYKNGLEDLHKARWYLNALIELHEND